MRLLDIRSFELKSDVHAVFDRVWKDLVQVDVEIGQVTIHDQLSGKSSLVMFGSEIPAHRP
jgi:protein transport protein DSL1/ZW10